MMKHFSFVTCVFSLFAYFILTCVYFCLLFILSHVTSWPNQEILSLENKYLQLIFFFSFFTFLCRKWYVSRRKIGPFWRLNGSRYILSFKRATATHSYGIRVNYDYVSGLENPDRLSRTRNSFVQNRTK